MINNYEKIKEEICPHHPENDTGVFYMFEVLQRKKDGHEHNRTIEIAYGNFYDVHFMDRLIELTKTFNARTYMKLNRCHEEPIALRTLAKMAQQIAEGQMNIRNCYDSVCGSYKPKDDVFWIIDVDEDLAVDKLDLSSIQKAQKQANQTPLTTLIDTVNGYHLITHPFNPQLFPFGDALKKNGLTVLFANQDQNKSKLPEVG